VVAFVLVACGKTDSTTNPPSGRYTLVSATVVDHSQGKVVGTSPRLFKIDTVTGDTWSFESNDDGKVRIDFWEPVFPDIEHAISSVAETNLKMEQLNQKKP
jgi:hypothetical protein